MKDTKTMTLPEIEAEIESLKSPLEKILDRDSRRMMLEKERMERLKN